VIIIYRRFPLEQNKGINDLIELIERNKIAQGRADWYNTGAIGGSEEEDEEAKAAEEAENAEPDFKEVQLLIFATEGPFTQSLEPMLSLYDLTYAITDTPDEAIDIAINNPQIQHVLIDLDRPTNPAMGMNVFSDLKTLNPNIQIFYCTKNPMSMESRNIQTKGAKLMQKPVLRKTLDHFMSENFKIKRSRDAVET
jgi:hypothetical protein